MSDRHGLGERNVRRTGTAACVVAVAGAALGLASPAAAQSTSMTILRQTMRMNLLDGFAGGLNSSGSTVVIGNLDGGHVWDTHNAFNDRVTRVWWPVDDFISIPPIPNAGDARGEFFTAHATAVASAAAGRWQFISGGPPGFSSVFGTSPGTPRILSGGFSVGTNQFGGFLGETENAKAFAFLAMIDPLFASSAVNLLGIEPYPLAKVVNMSFGRVGGNDRVGESMFNHVIDMAVVRHDVLVVAAAGDFDEDPVLEEMINSDPADTGGTVGGPSASYNALSVGRLNENQNSADDESSRGYIGTVDYRFTASTMISTIDPLSFEGCDNPQALSETMAGVRPGVHIAAPGTLIGLAGSPAQDPPDEFPQALSDNAFSSFWRGTSISSGIVAGIGAVAMDIATKQGYWELDDEGMPRPSGLAIRAILMNSARDDQPSPDVQSMTGDMGPESSACLFTRALGTKLGTGIVSPERIVRQLMANQATDVRADRPIFVDGIFRPLVGVTRGNFQPTPDDPRDLYRDDPELPAGSAITALVAGALAPPAQDWFGPWESGPTQEIIGTPRDRPFVTFVQGVQDAGVVRAPAPEPMDPTDRRPADAPGLGDLAESSRPFAQPTLERPRFDLDEPRFSFDSSGLTTAPTGQLGGSGGGGGSGTPGLPTKTGWDVGRMGVGFIDYPLGVLTPDSQIRATLVWNRTEVWAESSLNSLSQPVGFLNLNGANALKEQTVRMSQPFIDTEMSFPQPNRSVDGRGLPEGQEAFAFENLDLELWRAEPGGNVLVAASRQEWTTVEHVSVGPGALCQPDGEIRFGQYFLRVVYRDTHFDMGGYRWCNSLQSLQMLRPGLSVPYRNVYPAETDFGIAWFVDLAISAEFTNFGNLVDNPIDMNDDGEFDEVDQAMMVQAVKGDLNLDGVINASDLAILLSRYGTDDVLADLNQDGIVDGTDLLTVLSKFGQTP